MERVTKQKNITTNIIYNILNQIVSLIVPLILSPYVARVLSPELIGDYSYALANSSYFVLIESLGFSLYGMLKVAANRDDRNYISMLFKEIMLAKIVMMFLCTTVYSIVFLRILNSDKWLCLIMSLNIISSGIDSTWFLSGMEDFKTTTLRNVFVRIINVILVIVFVKSEQDFRLYAWIMQASNAISYLIVFPTVKKYTIPVKISVNHIFEHTKKSMAYFIPGLVNTIFSSADKTVLGAFANNYEVGVYEQSSKICTMCGTVINSISNVILPRVTYLNKTKSAGEAKAFLFKTIRGAIVISVAVTVGIISIANEFVHFFFGQGYEESVCLLKILAVNVLMSVVANYMGQQCLISVGKQHEYNIAISVGAGINLLINILLVNEMQAVGVCVASVISSVVVFAMVLIYSKSKILFNDIFAMSWKPIIAAVIMWLGVSKIYLDNKVVFLIVKVTFGILIYFAVLFILKEDFLIQMIHKLKNRNN